MEMFGLTLTGYDNYIKKMIRDDYEEPRHLPNRKTILNKRSQFNPDKKFIEIYNELDPILGVADGFSYGSYQRILLQRKKGLLKPTGPIDIYRFPLTCVQDAGFWMDDPVLKDADWTKWKKTYGKRFSEITKVLEKMRQIDHLGVIN